MVKHLNLLTPGAGTDWADSEQSVVRHSTHWTDHWLRRQRPSTNGRQDLLGAANPTCKPWTLRPGHGVTLPTEGSGWPRARTRHTRLAAGTFT